MRMAPLLFVLVLVGCGAPERKPVAPVVYRWPQRPAMGGGGALPAPVEAPDPTLVPHAIRKRAMKEGWMPNTDAVPMAAAHPDRFTGILLAAPPTGSPNPPRLVQTWDWAHEVWPPQAWAPDTWR